MAQEGLVLRERQSEVLENQQVNKEAYEQIDTAHPGYLDCQDTY